MDSTSTAELGIDLENQSSTMKSLLGQELSENWPQILNRDEEVKAYDALRDQGDNPAEPPKNSHIGRLSYELTNGDKRLRFFATFHQRDMNGQNDPNLEQYGILEKKFQESPPQLVLYEGFVDDVNHPLTREQALTLGEQAWICYLVQQHNKNVKEGRSIVIESGDSQVNTQPDNQVRDKYIVENAAGKFQKYDRVDMVFGSGHVIREKRVWEEYFGVSAMPLHGGSR